MNPKTPRALFLTELGLMLLLGSAALSWGGRHGLAPHTLIPVYFSFGYHVTALGVYLQTDWRAKLSFLLPGRILGLFLAIVWSIVLMLSNAEGEDLVGPGAELFLVPLYAVSGAALLVTQLGSSENPQEPGAP